MGYRVECFVCDFRSWNEEGKKRKETHSYLTGHKTYGGAKYWKHPTGDYYVHLFNEGLAGYNTMKYWSEQFVG